MRDKHQIIEEPCEGKLSCTVLKTNGVGDNLVEFNNQLGFHLAVLRNMGLLTAIRHTELSLWIETLDRHLKEKLETVSAQPEVAQALLNRLNRAMSDLAAVAEYLEG